MLDNVGGTNNKLVADNAYLDGVLDEVRIETIARSAARIAHDVAAEQDQVISYGPIER